MIRPISSLIKIMTEDDDKWQEFLNWLKDRKNVNIYAQYAGHEILKIKLTVGKTTSMNVIFGDGSDKLVLWKSLVKGINVTDDMVEITSNKMLVRIKE